MLYKTLAAAAVSIAMLGGAAYAQETPTVPQNLDQSTKEGNYPVTTGSVSDRTDWTSDAEQTWYTDNRARIVDFFTDDTMTEMRSDAEVREIFAAMGAEDQSEIKAACDRVNEDRGSYGSVTHGLCAQIGETTG